MKGRKVHLSTRNGNLRLRFTYQGEQLYLGLKMPDDEIHRPIAEQIAGRIALDIALGKLDKHNLKNYLPKPAAIDSPQTTLSLWWKYAQFRKDQGTSESTINGHYKSLAANLARFGGEILTPEDAALFVKRILKPRQCPRTINDNQKMLRGFGRWLTKQGYRNIDPFVDLAPVKARRDRTKRQPFTLKEMAAILKSAKDSKRCPGYYEFIKALLHLGLRPSEAIGLRWGDLDLERRQIAITSALARGPDGRSASTGRQRKALKTGEAGNRVLDLVPEMVDMLRWHRPKDAKNSDLIFLSPQGKAIDDHAFSQRCWRRILEDAGVKHRPPYTCRHTLISHLLESGATERQAADVAGHTSTEMISRTYSHLINRPEMPTFNLS
jgi:integrase